VPELFKQRSTQRLLRQCDGRALAEPTGSLSILLPRLFLKRDSINHHLISCHRARPSAAGDVAWSSHSGLAAGHAAPISHGAPGLRTSLQASAPPQATASGPEVKLPLESKSVRFAVIGDSGTGEREPYDVAKEMKTYRQKVGFDFVIMLGDNIYGGHRSKDFAEKFEQPYKPLLDAGVKFYASLGNHDDPNEERLYEPFNMGGERYYTSPKVM